MEMLKYRINCCLIALNRTVFLGLIVICIPFTLGMSVMWSTALDHHPRLTYPQKPGSGQRGSREEEEM
ncbi:hypothetical protein KC365_g12945 [Hortaea werneckii]|nr:hypothetical protein KC342_g516 [Hortaea werneckii]KAI7217408.1 hypothetical protein KC365_g12945 [Hortaea werneckii]KAI7385159.1 hypothetical protein KC328_g10465 [Hortaea werneckii]